MGRIKEFSKNILLSIIVLFLMIGSGKAVSAELNLTEVEKDYISEKNIIKAASIDGVAPLNYTNSKGEKKGIAIRVLDEISDMTGLIFEYDLYESIEEAFASNPDILFGISKSYAPEDMVLSKPFLEAEAILYMNSSLKPDGLKDKIYAGIRGGKLPKGIKKENVIYCDTREEALTLVEKGGADYGHGNPYSLAYYTLKNDYKNIITVPTGKEPRGYSIGFQKENKTQLSIINKAIENISESRMQTIILEEASTIDRELTVSMIMNTYGVEIGVIVSLIIIALSLNVVITIRNKNNLQHQNKKYELLSNISNECIYEYNLKTDNLVLSEKCYQLFGEKEMLKDTVEILKKNLLKLDTDGDISNFNIPLSNDNIGIFKAINSRIIDKKGNKYEMIGKLIDISEEIRERERLIEKSQTDGLTGLYNATTTRKLISEIIEHKDSLRIDAFVILDCDKFKSINDTYGHLVGDMVLKNISKGLMETFRETDIIGRIGGDEFLVYVQNIPFAEFVYEKGESLVKRINEINDAFDISLSIGFTIVKAEKIYDELFKKADKALYEGKKKGLGYIILYESK